MSNQLLEQIFATFWFWIFSVGFLGSIAVSTLVLLFTPFWWLLLIYIAWIVYDRKTCEKGGRPIQSVREWSWWKLMKNYFKFKLVTDGEVNLDESKNYLFACYPHGILPVGTFASFVDGYQNLFPKHTAFTTVLGLQFWMPVIRELFLAIGAVSVSGPSIRHLLKKADGGNIVSILVGGADESRYSRPGQHKIILMKRKGFIKLAMQLEAPLVPVYTFGETDVFDQLDFPGFAFVRDLIRRITQIGLVIPMGTCLVCPKSVPVTTVVGQPIPVVKNENPTNEDIDELHGRFVNAMKELFERNKYKYVAKPEEATLEIV